MAIGISSAFQPTLLLDPAPSLAVVGEPIEPVADHEKTIPNPDYRYDSADSSRAAIEFAAWVRSLPRIGRLSAVAAAGGHGVFASDHCPGVSIREEVIPDMWTAFGLALDEQSVEDRQFLAARMESIYAALLKAPATSCDRAWIFFGDEGTRYPGLLARG